MRSSKRSTVALDLFSHLHVLLADYQQLEQLLNSDLSEKWIVNMAMRFDEFNIGRLPEMQAVKQCLIGLIILEWLPLSIPLRQAASWENNNNRSFAGAGDKSQLSSESIVIFR